MRVKLVSKAAAKSHRPEHLFSAQSCPIVSGGGLGELFVKATPEGLDRLTEIIETQHVRPDDEGAVLRRDDRASHARLIGAAALKQPTCFATVRAARTASSRVWVCSTSAPDRDQPKLVEDLEAACKRRDIALSNAWVFAFELHL